MAELTDYLPALSIGTKVSEITGNGIDGLTAGGYTAFITSITGRPPYVQTLANKRARLLLDSQQNTKFQQYLDRELGIGMLMLKKKQSLDIDVRAAVIPWALKYIVPATALIFISGWVAHWYASK
jgi:hypothetical protein